MSTTGFDIVIGNPPYLDNRAIDSDIKLNAGFKQVNKKSFRPNLYLFFIEQALRILKNNQVLIFINPNQFLSTEMGFGIRSYILDEFSIIRIDDVSYLKVFKEASTYTSIFIIKKAFKDGQRIIINRCSTLGDLGKISFSLNNRNIIATPSKLISLNINNELVTKIEAKHKQFEHFGKFLWGTSQSGYGALKISQQEYNDLPNGKRKLYEPIIQTADIKKFHINWKGEYIPVEIFSDSVKANFNKPKLVIARLTKTLQCSIDFNKFYVGKSTVITDIAIDLDYLLGLLNSKVIDFWYYAKFETTHMQGGYIRYDLPYLKQIPIPIPDKETMNSIAEIAINLRKNIDFIENLHNLNLKIFKLYNLDYNSAFSIDPEIKMSEIEYNNFLLN
ncbi:Eco57I restriction-modification methylase domain-containing protein [Mucilaginibacter rubeus]|uniref:Eco57I restriction-modification methylase domain-containing protein n=1 Tax=Mucilaginibacter rubeus TaxID=2027860 RepID=UPI003FA44301